MILTVDPGSHVPPFEQVREQIRGAIGTGALTEGARLPPVRRLAADLGLAPNTVARAYRELEAEGLLHGRGSRGTFVHVPRPTDPVAALRGDARALAEQARNRSVPLERLLALLEQEWSSLG